MSLDEGRNFLKYKNFNQQEFNKAAEEVKTLTKRPTDDELLKLYALFKQGSVGDNNTSKPGILDLKGKAKWNAWNNLKGTTQDAAKQEYVDFANELLAKYE
ncbi:Acyl-CoA-binding protein like [Pseudolycoriella hygida]|uniref:Acyl-CoA-binding protein like n=1 Tax=Pseudolycoriella hygida TaxID=35572 RepID=A0A9Q0S172_9DIPT|nr:Acyl-CoA-binding protein like [Pseudolycoriella hygida]